jgi:hypothetical protein
MKKDSQSIIIWRGASLAEKEKCVICTLPWSDQLGFVMSAEQEKQNENIL